MDIERAIEHLLELHARAEVRMDRQEARMKQVDKRLETLSRVVEGGIKMVIDLRQAQRETTEQIRAMAADQKELRGLMKAFLRRSTNGGRRNG